MREAPRPAGRKVHEQPGQGPESFDELPVRRHPRLTTEQVALAIPHLPNNEAQTDCYVGKRGYGKTTALRRWLASGPEARVLQLDIYDELDGPRSPSIEHAVYDLARFGPCWRRVSPPRGGTRAYGDHFLRQVLEYVRDCVIVIDEVTKFFDADGTDDLEELVFQGRKYGLRFASTTQRVNELPRQIRAEATRLVLYHTTWPYDLQEIGRWTGSEQVKAEAPTLQRGECFLITL